MLDLDGAFNLPGYWCPLVVVVLPVEAPRKNEDAPVHCPSDLLQILEEKEHSNRACLTFYNNWVIAGTVLDGSG